MIIDRKHHDAETLALLWRANAISDDVYTAPDTLCVRGSGAGVVVYWHDSDSGWWTINFVLHDGTAPNEGSGYATMDMETGTLVYLEDLMPMFAAKDGKYRNATPVPQAITAILKQFMFDGRDMNEELTRLFFNNESEEADED